ncbi:hypothetical protein MKK55_03055 [Methylobacterium sp. J-059]|uniref:hypothetical protein n=1 Tax=Methylobacterium sp. J-059 TaxID=2836643 RepID=UPI001FBA37D2|nr:hypothetical protein [Methylobacterium sp. J-059]MCJ2037940.1 hypothetical protein [Methylobacterium sp. J-059]
MQQIDYLEGREFPAELGRFLTPDGVLVRNPRQPTDVFVVEISTVKEIVFDTWYLQINYLERTFRDREGLLETFFGLKGERDPEVRRRHFEALPDFAETDALERRVLTEGYIRSTTRDELEAHMAEIVRRLPADVVFVTLTESSAGTTLQLPGETILLEGVHLHAVTADWAHFA